MRRPPPTPSPTDALFHAVIGFVKRYYPNHRCIRLVIELNEGQEIRLPLGLCDCCQIGGPDMEEEQTPLTEQETSEVTLRDADRAILAALGDQRLSLKQLATASAYRLNPHFRGLVKDMLRRGLLVRDADNVYSAGPNAPGDDRQI